MLFRYFLEQGEDKILVHWCRAESGPGYQVGEVFSLEVDGVEELCEVIGVEWGKAVLDLSNMAPGDFENQDVMVKIVGGPSPGT